MLFKSNTFIILSAFFLLTNAQSIFDLPGPVLPLGPIPMFSTDHSAARRAISRHKLGGFCNQLNAASSGGSTSTSFISTSPGVRGRSRTSSYNSNVNSNVGGTGGSSSFSSSYSNNNGRISGYVSGHPGPGGLPYSYEFGNAPELGQSEDWGAGNADENVNYNAGSTGSVIYNINGVQVPKALQDFSPDTIQRACAQVLAGSEGEASGEIPYPYPPPYPNQPGSQRRVRFRNVYYGAGTDLPLRNFEVAGLRSAAYVPYDFGTYRRACAQAAASSPDSTGFVVSTDFSTNTCWLVYGEAVGREGFIDESSGGDGNGKVHMEGYAKIYKGEVLKEMQ